MSSDFHRKQARSFGQRILRQLRRIANYGAPHTAVRVTLHTIDGGELIGHVDLDFATADILTDLAKTQADTWDRETGVTSEPSNDESIASGEWSAAAVAQCDPDLYADVTDVLMLLDPIEITDKVLRDRQADLPDVARVLDELYGDIPYPYAEEDVPLPHDQASMDALTAEVESYLRDGDL